MEDNVDILHAANKIPKFAKLPCSPYSADWKGSANIRTILRDMFAVAGYKASGMRITLG